MKERKDIEEKFKWNLSTLFADDEAFEEELRNTAGKLSEVGAFAGKLKDADSIAQCFAMQTELDRKLNNLLNYAELRKSEDTRDGKAVSLWSRAYTLAVQAMSAASYIQPEILSLPAEELAKITTADVMKPYRFLMQDLIRQKPHTLDQKEERILATLQEVMGKPGEIAGALQDADLKFEPATDSDGKEHEVSNANYILLESSADRTLRKNAFVSAYKGYADHIHTFAQTYDGCVKAAVTEAALRQYPSSLAASLAADNIPVSVYEELISTVHAHMEVMYRYERLRKRLLKLDDLHYYDLYASLVGASSRSYSYEEAEEMVLKAVSVLGDDYVTEVKKGLASRWVDVYPNVGKTSGAFSAGTFDSNPYIMLNFTGMLADVSTLAHEMGHSMHSYLTNTHQPVQYSNYSLFVAEVASTVNENLLIDQLLKNCTDDQERMVLLNQYLEGFKGTIYRQTMFAEFEKEAHAMVERGESLDSSSLNALYEKLIHLYFGDELVWDPQVAFEWAKIPHFYRPFYVYVYATGYASAVTISETILKEGKPAADRYKEFLSMGGSAYPLDELKHAGVDLTTPKPVETALAKFAEVVADAEATAHRLGM